MKSTVSLTEAQLDSILKSVGLSYEDLIFALDIPGPLSNIWLRAACQVLDRDIGTTSFIIVEDEEE